jgi:hypothetical protein
MGMQWDSTSAIHGLQEILTLLVGKYSMYNILIEFMVPVEIITLIKGPLNETFNKFCIGKHLSVSFLI